MKTLHVPFHFYPEAVGGTEVYAFSLVQHLREMGHDAEIAAPGAREERYSHQGVGVYRFAVGKVSDVSDIYGAGDETAAEQFEEILRVAEPDVVHLHGISPAISLRLLRRIKAAGLPVILTAHIPGIVCGRGTLMENGARVCDGVITVRRCTACVLQGRGASRPLARILAHLPRAAGVALAKTGAHAPWITAMRMTDLQSMRQSVLKQLLGEVDLIVTVSEWLRETLIRNGVPEEKVMLCRHGATQTEFHSRSETIKEGVKRIAFCGRLIEAKGVHTLVDAVLRRPELPLRLDIYGIVQEGSGDSYVNRLRTNASNDRRIRILEPLPNNSVVEKLREYDAMAIPSLWLETGPLTVYDAFAAGIPVIGSRRAGLIELVTDGQDGLLVEPGDVDAWSNALSRACCEPGLLERLRLNVRFPRTMKTVAAAMLALYEKLQMRAGASVR